jgi:malate dehydrogenase (oxaloacetate-decarboxylating)(NADP+)
MLGRLPPLMGRDGASPRIAKRPCASDNTLIGAMLLKLGYADGLICGTTGRYDHHLRHVSRRSSASARRARRWPR